MSTDAAVAVRLIGGIRGLYDGHDVGPQVVGGRRCAEIIAYLAAHRHRDVSQEELARVVWADRRPQSWYAGLRQALSRVRDTMDIAALPTNTVRSRGGNVRLTLPEDTATDLEVVHLADLALSLDDLDAAATAVLRRLDAALAPWTDSSL